MYKLAHLQETKRCQPFTLLPLTVQKMIEEVLSILDKFYGPTRDATTEGGFVAIIEIAEDVNALNDLIHVNLAAETFEYVDAASGYLGCLLILGTEYHLYLVLPQSLAPLNILNQMETS